MKVVDSHVHLTDERLVGNAHDIVGRFLDDGIEFVVEVSASVPESRTVLEFAARHENVFCTIGVHPMMVGDYDDDFETWAFAQRGNEKLVAIGEIGLDYYHLDFPPETQKSAFERQIKLADRMKLPIVIHTRDAFDDTLAVLVANKKFIRRGILFHCFSETADAVARVREHFDAFFAFGGAVTYKKNSFSADAIRAVPRDRLLIETDSPYLTPEPHRGKLNEPKNVRLVAEYVARILETSFDDVAALTTANAKTFFRQA
jgi:TatD DNase family protein